MRGIQLALAGIEAGGMGLSNVVTSRMYEQTLANGQKSPLYFIPTMSRKWLISTTWKGKKMDSVTELPEGNAVLLTPWF
jgi:hypothetical protein